MNRKIAVVTDDNTTVCPHFGRATHYLVFTVGEDGSLEQEIRRKEGHHTRNVEHLHGPDHNGADQRHRRMAEAIKDCRIAIVGGMGMGAREALKAAGIEPCSTDIRDAEEAVRAYLRGVAMREPDCLTKAAGP